MAISSNYVKEVGGKKGESVSKGEVMKLGGCGGDQIATCRPLLFAIKRNKTR